MWDPFKVRYRVLLERRSQLLNDINKQYARAWAGLDLAVTRDSLRVFVEMGKKLRVT